MSVVTNGSPRSQQLLKYDLQKVSDLQNMTYSISSYFSLKGVLPNDFADVYNGNYYNKKLDPQSQQPYEYRKTKEYTYEVCAEFNKKSEENKNTRYYGDENNWEHPAGKYCFIRSVNPNLYQKPAVPMVQPYDGTIGR